MSGLEDLDSLLDDLNNRNKSPQTSSSNSGQKLNDLDDLLADLERGGPPTKSNPPPSSAPKSTPPPSTVASSSQKSTSNSSNSTQSKKSEDLSKMIPLMNDPNIVTCISCNLKILDEALVANKQTWHAKCLACARCAKPLKGEKFLPGDAPNVLFCTQCGLRWLHESGKLKK